MGDQFHKKIRQSLENDALQTALDGNAERRMNARRQAYASLPDDLQVLRQRAHAIRAHTIADLDSLLAQFVANAEENGWKVYRAADASQAVKIVLEIAKQKNAHLIAKSKTMVGEEIEINTALESAGLTVVETDLGEYIVQLRHERPAHIITPAVHLRRSDVARTFSEKLGVPYNEDIPTMTGIARQKLRQVFLDTDIGISGVNFGIASEGSICLLTNEGNGRMVTTLPKVHIALMGMERLLPTLDDLALMLLLLPRSATGQKMTVYTSLIRGPRQPDDPDGPQERYLIILDNGRSAMIGTGLEEALLCIRCGACLNACPVFREIGGHGYIGTHGDPTAYSGPIGSVLSAGLLGASEFGNLARASSLCGACKEACPVDIDLPDMLLKVRAGYTGVKVNTQSQRPNRFPSPTQVPSMLRIGLILYSWAASSPWRFKTAQRLAGWLPRAMPSRFDWIHFPAFTGWGLSRDFPRPATKTFHERFAQRQSTPTKPVSSQSESLAAVNQLETGTHPNVLSPAQSINERPSQPPANPDELLHRFCRELTSLGVQAIICPAADLNAKLCAFLSERQVNCIQTWDSNNLPPGLLEDLHANGIETSSGMDTKTHVGLTGAAAGIADTGTLVLPGSPGQPLSTSLLPETHIAILNQSQLVENLASFFKQIKTSDDSLVQATSLVLITGPSRTSDIEMTLTIGVHGPGELIVFCLSN